ncbi:MAG TPA: hypothetical protein VIK73_00720 [Limnochordales bacterium]
MADTSRPEATAPEASGVPLAGTPGGATGGPLVMTAAEAAMWWAVAVAMPVIAVLLIIAAPRLAAARFLTAPAFALTHAITLGLGSTMIMGAAYQMSGALLGERLWTQRWVPWQLAAFIVGATALVAGFYTSRIGWLILGGSLVTAMAWGFGIIMARAGAALRRRRAAGQAGPQGRLHGRAMAVSAFSFGLVTTWGLVLALGFRFPLWPALYVDERGLLVHLALGLGGWFALMVVGVSYRLVPIVHGVRIADERRGRAIVILLVMSVVLQATGALLGAAWPLKAAVVSASLAGPLYVWELVYLLRRRRRKSPDLNVDHWWALCVVTLALSATGLAWAAGLVGTRPPERLGLAAGVAFLLGWVVQAILGQLYKVTPFLMWYYRATVPDVLQIPLLPDLYAPRAGKVAFWATNGGLVLLVAGILSGATWAAQAGAWLYGAGLVAASALLGYGWLPAVLTRRVPFRWRVAGRRAEA